MARLSERQKEIIRNRVSRRRAIRKFKAPVFPDMIIMEYGKAINKEVDKIDSLIKEILVPELDRIVSTKDSRFDITKEEIKKAAGVALVALLVAKVKSAFYGESLSADQEPRQTLFSKVAKRISEPFIKRADKFQKDRFVAEFERQTGTRPIESQIDVKEFIDDATRKNVSLIKTIPQKYLGQVQTLVENAVGRGQLASEVTKELKNIKDKIKDNSRFIARDQISKLTGVINEARQRKLGVEEYIWRTMQDSRVRSLANTSGRSDHKRLEGTIQRWDSPPVTIFSGKLAGSRAHPRQDPGCRCEAQPVYDEITGINHPDTVEARKKSA